MRAVALPKRKDLPAFTATVPVLNVFAFSLFCIFDRVTPILTASTLPSDKIFTCCLGDSGLAPSKAHLIGIEPISACAYRVCFTSAFPLSSKHAFGGAKEIRTPLSDTVLYLT